ncbi:AbrB family transcriptional regulator [Salinicoccus halitifaciens]|uniref:Membrane AbrB-like protein n=1 Tax=Salinicoccus halitifaciens TaxID=1073415 RepID=A0ABV2E624_9STAP|nr:AbrB family transcriptional regulator [Salinicoccus halitifaciens]MCD2137060.1 AbrB family transcriptional regulator [Salinicoccus halitifaciens]
MKIIRLTALLLLALGISSILNAAGMVLPWLFGSMAATFLFIRFVTDDFYFPKWMGNLGVFVIGFEIGSTFTTDAMQEMIGDIWNIFFISLLVISLSLGLSRIFMKLTGCTPETALLSSVPGALSQMLILAEEDKKADLMLVTITQMSRIILVVILVPFIASLFAADQTVSSEAEEPAPLLSEVFEPSMLLIVAGAFILMYIFRLIRFPVPFLLGPIIAVLIWNITTGYHFSLNIGFMNVAQILFGIRIGRQIASLLYQLNRRMIVSMLIQNILLIGGTLLITGIYQMFTVHSFNNLFLSAAPGGIGQLIIVAVEMGADIAMISSYHIFRIFFIILIVTPLVSWYLRYRRRRQGRT